MLIQELLNLAQGRRPRHRPRKMFDQMILWRVHQHRFPVIHSERHLGGGSLLTGKCNDGYGGEDIDMIAGQVRFASRPAIRKVGVDGQLHVLVWIAILGPRTLALAETRDNADADPSTSRGLHKCSTDRCHYTLPATGKKVHSEASEKLADVSSKQVVLIGTRTHYPYSLACNDWV